MDGSRAGLEAAGWAAVEAALRRTPLTVAHAVPRWVCEAAGGRYAEVNRWMREGAQTVLATAHDRALRERPGLLVETLLLPGDPRTALIKAAEDAELLVVGSRGIGGVRGLLVGSVAYGVAAHARTDVVLVRDRPPPKAHPPGSPERGSSQGGWSAGGSSAGGSSAGGSSAGGEVVAGVDGSTGAHRALGFAFDYAERHGMRLRAVQAWAWPHAEGFAPADPISEQDVRQTLQEVLARHRERHPGVDVIAEVVHGHPVEVLREAAAGADLLVVGSRGHGQLAGMLMGSISQAMLHHAPCPLAVARHA
ncbi:universal stress protein [Nonomuraea zeae]|uniref:Universal stress protein n=1 Tax=Nonomuraea zeae TaxID=1642303 RepID=A0A5S4F956_9ACTN|nr:universal stress protein [Nonomuraea zeae]